MSQDVRIDAEFRSDFGKGASRRYRRDGLVPAVMYGSGSQLRHVTLPAHELDLALRIPRVVLQVHLDGSQFVVAPADVQRKFTQKRTNIAGTHPPTRLTNVAFERHR